MLPKCYSVLQSAAPALQSATPVPLCTTKYCSSTTVLQSATQVLLCTTSYCSSTTKCYSSTTLHYKVPLQCCSVHCSGATRYHSNTTQSIAEHYSSTTLHHYCVLQSATPVLLCSATPVALLKWSGRGCRRPGSFEKRLLMCKKLQPTVPEPGDNRAEPGLEPMTSRLRSGG